MITPLQTVSLDLITPELLADAIGHRSRTTHPTEGPLPVNWTAAVEQLQMALRRAAHEVELTKVTAP